MAPSWGRRIKADPILGQTLMIMLTSHGMRGDASEMKRIGFSGYLTKPVRRVASLRLHCHGVEPEPAAGADAAAIADGDQPFAR